MREHHFRFELGQTVRCVLGEVQVLGRTAFMVPESYLVEIDEEQAWVLADELSPLPASETN